MKIHKYLEKGKDINQRFALSDINI